MLYIHINNLMKRIKSARLLVLWVFWTCLMHLYHIILGFSEVVVPEFDGL